MKNYNFKSYMDEVTTTAQTPQTTSDPLNILNFTIPKNNSLPACLRAKFSLALEIKYQTVNEINYINK